MSTEVTTTGQNRTISAETMELVIGRGNLTALDSKQRVEYLMSVCSSMGLNPLTRPIQLITMDGKTVPYATRDCTDQLRRIHGVDVEIVSREQTEDLYIVTARATLNGRRDESIGAVSLANLRNEGIANAIMKCESKAKRRVTLSICGLGFIDGSEVESIQIAAAVPPPAAPDVPWKTKGEMVKLFEEQRARIGAEAYYGVLGAEALEEAANLKPTAEDRGRAARIWTALTMASNGVGETEVTE